MTPPNQREDRRRRLTELSNRINTFLRKGDVEQALRELAHGKEMDPSSNLIRALEKQVENYIAQHGRHNKDTVSSKALHGYSQDSRLQFEGEARIVENIRQIPPGESPRAELSSSTRREIEDARKINQDRERIERERMRFQEEVRKLEHQRNRIEEERLKFEDGMKTLAEQRRQVEEELKRFEEEANKLKEARARHEAESGSVQEGPQSPPPAAERPPEAKQGVPQGEGDEHYLSWQDWAGQDSRNRIEEELRKRIEQQREMDGRRIRMEHEAKKLKDRERRLDEEWHRKEARLHELEEQSRLAAPAQPPKEKAPPPKIERAEKTEKPAPAPVKEKPAPVIRREPAKRSSGRMALYGLMVLAAAAVLAYVFLVPSAQQPAPVQPVTQNVAAGGSGLKTPENTPQDLAKVSGQPAQRPEQTTPRGAAMNGQPTVPAPAPPPAEKKAELPVTRDDVPKDVPPAKQNEAKIDMGVPVSNVPSTLGNVTPPKPTAKKKTAKEPPPKTEAAPPPKVEPKADAQPKQSAAQQSGGGATDEGDLTVHTVKKGETLASIARKYSTTIESIKRWNSLTAEALTPGQELYVFVKNK
jgi:LysM repeat protein